MYTYQPQHENCLPNVVRIPLMPYGCLLWCLAPGHRWNYLDPVGYELRCPQIGLIQIEIWGVWGPGWHIEPFALFLDPFQNVFCGVIEGIVLGGGVGGSAFTECCCREAMYFDLSAQMLGSKVSLQNAAF